MSDPIQALAEVSAWNLKHQERISELERQLAEAQAQAAAMRGALDEIMTLADTGDQDFKNYMGPELFERGFAALAPEAGRNYRASILEEAATVANSVADRCRPRASQNDQIAADVAEEIEAGIRHLAESTSPDVAE